MNHWPFIWASYLVTLGGAFALAGIALVTTLLTLSYGAAAASVLLLVPLVAWARVRIGAHTVMQCAGPVKGSGEPNIIDCVKRHRRHAGGGNEHFGKAAGKQILQIDSIQIDHESELFGTAQHLASSDSAKDEILIRRIKRIVGEREEVAARSFQHPSFPIDQQCFKSSRAFRFFEGDIVEQQAPALMNWKQPLAFKGDHPDSVSVVEVGIAQEFNRDDEEDRIRSAIEGDSNGRVTDSFRFDELIHPAADRFFREGMGQTYSLGRGKQSIEVLIDASDESAQDP